MTAYIDSSTMHQIDEIIPGPHSTIRVYRDDSKTPDDNDHLWVTQTYDPPSKDTPIWVVPLHWHQYHDEHLEILEGALNIYHHDKWHLVTPESGVVFAERGMVHGFKSIPGVRLVLKERVTPTGDYKVAFFKDVGQRGSAGPGFWLVMRIAYYNDLYPWLSRFKWIDWMFVTLVGGFARLFEPPPPVPVHLVKPS
ncbi:hypothetical protein BS50DRAFT_674216 [Corynespora cassiicola Philippines]|uniref:Cupin 2 conserved barrel domain-containing protein n=1 Tax=Corynespora cassiicola Philippines TaxID=1448308 RepID=A0A2T2NWL0_CORCC|nr:hypothetical protein BS50DRAFT_674216 [Corynespora cassiicola Philippines]